MATELEQNVMTLRELSMRHDPDGDASMIAEVLEKTNEIMMDIPWTEANDRLSHTIVRRTTLPSGSWRQFNTGVAAEVSKTQQVIETVGMLESYSEVDAALVKIASNPDQFRTQEAKSFIEGMGQTMASTLMYGNATTYPDRFDGFATRMPSLAATQNVIGSGGTGSDLTSVFIVQWGLDKVFCVYPKGHKTMGVERRDLGEDTKGTTTLYQVMREHFKISMGLVVKDDRCIARLANCENASTNTVDEDNLIKLLNRMPNSGRGAKLYVNDNLQSIMEIKLKDKSNVYYTAGGGEGLAGEPLVKFRGNAVRKVDAIVQTEAALT